MKKFLLILLGLLLAGCSAVAEVTEPVVEATEPVVEATEPPTVFTTEPESIPATEPATEPVLSVNEALSNVWDIMDNACVEEIPILPGLLKDDIKDWMEQTPFTEIKLYQRTDWNSVRLGVYGDVAVAQISMLKGDNITGEELVWNVRMEKADKLENKTAIEIPADADIGDYEALGKDDARIPARYYNWVTSGSADDKSQPATMTAMYQVYFEDTQNLYTFYTADIVYNWNGESWVSNSDRMPSVVVNHIQADGQKYYDHINGDAIAAGVRDVRYFRIKMAGQGKKTYQYEFGMTMGQWVKSKYNTDGWTSDPNDPYSVMSADGRYKMSRNDYCWREMTALLR